MLDEPTNHLDIHSVDLLVEALNKYEGSLILVSHDRYFISRIANKIWEIDENLIREFKGPMQNGKNGKPGVPNPETVSSRPAKQEPVAEIKKPKLLKTSLPGSMQVTTRRKSWRKSKPF